VVLTKIKVVDLLTRDITNKNVRVEFAFLEFLFLTVDALALFEHLIRDDSSRTALVVASTGLGDVDTVHDVLDVLGLELDLHAVLEELLAGRGLDSHDTIVSEGAHGDDLEAVFLLETLEEVAVLLRELLGLDDIDLVGGEDEGLVGKEGLDVLKEGGLLLETVTAGLRDVEEVDDGGTDVGERRDGLHLDGVSVLKRVVEDTWGVDDLPATVLVVSVTDKERLGGEGVGLDLDISASELVHETTLSDVGVATEKERSGVGVDGRKTRKMLTHLFEVLEGRVLALHERTHTTEGSLLELLASVERVSVLEKTHVVLAEVLDEVSASVELTESELVVILVVQNVDQVSIERVDFLLFVHKDDEEDDDDEDEAERSDTRTSKEREKKKDEEGRQTSRRGKSERIWESFSTKFCWVNLTLRM
jgi:hypothetical protein